MNHRPTCLRRHRCHARTLLGAGLLAAALGAGPVAWAAGVSPMDATADQKKQALGLFTAGKDAIGKKDFDKGIERLRGSLDIVNSPNTRLILSRALRDSARFAEAWSEYSRTIAAAKELAAKEPKYAEAANAASTERAEIESKVALVVVNVSHGGEGVVLKVGGRTVPAEEQSAPIAVTAGAVDVVAERGGTEVAKKTVTAKAGEKTPVAIDAQGTAEPATGPVVAPPDNGKDPLTSPDQAGGDQPAAADKGTPPASGGNGLRTVAYVAGGVGIAGLATFGIFGLMSNSSYSDLQNACHPGCPASKQDEISSGKTQQTIANIGLGVGIIGVATGVTLFFLSSPSKSAPSGSETSLVIGPTYVGVRGSL